MAKKTKNKRRGSGRRPRRDCGRARAFTPTGQFVGRDHRGRPRAVLMADECLQSLLMPPWPRLRNDPASWDPFSRHCVRRE
jgi:hypothetical protein